jgi:hypothetical protein
MLRVVTRDLGRTVEIRVNDNRIGIADEVEDKLFQPSFPSQCCGHAIRKAINGAGKGAILWPDDCLPSYLIITDDRANGWSRPKADGRVGARIPGYCPSSG